ncbi:MAG: prephenate dehydratase [Verrucomicrobia bacterium]|nr:prephenate dehydratase [Verrucomicrobiota bacterium]
MSPKAKPLKRSTGSIAAPSTASIAEQRAAIDRVDRQIIELLNERTRHVLEIGRLKLKAGDEIYAPHRERAVLERLCQLNRGPMANASLRAIYREIMSGALGLEKSLTIAYFGPQATFTHQAAIRRFGSSLQYVPLRTIADVFAEVARNRADYGVVPVENSTEGVVTSTLDMFVDSELKIVSQVILPIQHCLVGLGPPSAVRTLYSHPQALAQCRNWVQNHLPTVEIIDTSSTTRAAELAGRKRSAAAIASSLAAERYRLRILYTDIQDNSNNATRFLVLGRQGPPPSGHDRTSLLMSMADKVGALHRALAPFRRYGINLTKIESRPSKRKAWAYFFFIDLDGHITDRRIVRALEHVQPHCDFIKVLGSYPNSE